MPVNTVFVVMATGGWCGCGRRVATSADNEHSEDDDREADCHEHSSHQRHYNARHESSATAGIADRGVSTAENVFRCNNTI